MSARNFYNKNAKHIFAVSTDSDFEIECLQANIENAIEATKKSCTIHYAVENALNYYGRNNNSYPEKIFDTCLFSSKEYKTFTIELYLVPVLRSGYYDGGNLDYYQVLLVDGYEIDFDNIQDIDLSDFTNKHLEKYTKQWIEKELNTLSDLMNSILNQHCDSPLDCVGVFSNGEAIYQSTV